VPVASDLSVTAVAIAGCKAATARKPPTRIMAPYLPWRRLRRETSPPAIANRVGTRSDSPALQG
jgi:hypothetical protein